MKLPIPQDWNGEEWCEFAICWPNSENWIAILRGFVSLPGRGWTWDERTGSILDVQAIGKEIIRKNLPERICLMSCDNEILEQIANNLSALATATATANASSCCGDREVNITFGYQGSASSEGGDIPIYGTEPPFALEEGETFPPEFENQEEFDQHKCSIAHAIFDGVTSTLTFLAGLNVANLTGLGAVIGLGIAGIIVFPPSAIVIMVGFLFTLAGFLTMFLQLRDAMIENKQEFICAMYDSASVTEAISVIADLLDIIIATITTTSSLGLALKLATLLLFNSDTLNRLYDKSVDFLYPEADCSICEEECTLVMWSDIGECDGQGEITSQEGNVYEIQSELCQDNWTADFYLTLEPGNINVQCDKNITIEILTGSVVGGFPSNYRFWENSGASVWDNAFPPDYPICASNGSIRSANEFTIRVTLTDCV